jgi:hypothetical protein
LAFVVVDVLVSAAGVLVELLFDPPELPQPATTTTIAIVEMRARFIGWTPVALADVGVRVQMFSAAHSCCVAAVGRRQSAAAMGAGPRDRPGATRPGGRGTVL